VVHGAEAHKIYGHSYHEHSIQMFLLGVIKSKKMLLYYTQASLSSSDPPVQVSMSTDTEIILKSTLPIFALLSHIELFSLFVFHNNY
jgi:hypothetical protein